MLSEVADVLIDKLLIKDEENIKWKLKRKAGKI